MRNERKSYDRFSFDRFYLNAFDRSKKKRGDMKKNLLCFRLIYDVFHHFFSVIFLLSLPSFKEMQSEWSKIKSFRFTVLTVNVNNYFVKFITIFFLHFALWARWLRAFWKEFTFLFSYDLRSEYLIHFKES